MSRILRVPGAFGERVAKKADVVVRKMVSRGPALPISRIYDGSRASNADPKRLDVREYEPHVFDVDGYCNHCGWRDGFAPSATACFERRLPRVKRQPTDARRLDYTSPAALLRSVRRRQRRFA